MPQKLKMTGAGMQDLRSVLVKHGFHFKKQFGQNFISDGNLLRSIVEASGNILKLYE